MKNFQKPICQATLASALLFSPTLFGAGFQLAERSASGLGRAFSGEAAIADDASVLASNPAAMMMLGGNWNYSVGASLIEPGASADIALIPALGGGTLQDDDIAETAVVPYLYLTKRLSEDLVVGIGSFTTYGLKTNYSDNVANFIGTNFSDITSVNINPSISYRLTDHISIGAGFNVLYAEGELTANAVGPNPSFGLDGDDLAFGFNLGVLFELCENTRVGLSYRSAIDLTLEGDVTGSITGLVGATSLPGTLDVELPATAELSLFHQINQKWAVHADILWTDWSAFQEIAPQTGAPFDPLLASEQNWDDAFRYSIGATYQHNSQWTFRAGLAFDESPTNDQFRPSHPRRRPDLAQCWCQLRPFGSGHHRCRLHLHSS